jgi:hypothetical protein
VLPEKALGYASVYISKYNIITWMLVVERLPFSNMYLSNILITEVTLKDDLALRKDEYGKIVF